MKERYNFRMKAITTPCVSIACLLNFRVVGPAMEVIGKVTDIRVNEARDEGEILVEFLDKLGTVGRVAWRDAVISTDRKLVMIVPALIK